MHYFSVDVPDAVREFLGACARTNSLNLCNLLNPQDLHVFKKTWEQWADQQDEDLYNNGSFMCAGVSVSTEIPFFVLGMRHAVWENHHNEVEVLVAGALAHNCADILEKSVWTSVEWEYAEQQNDNGRGQYTSLTTDTSALNLLINAIPMTTLDHILIRCHEHPIKDHAVYRWLEERKAQRLHALLTQAIDAPNKGGFAKKM